MTAATAVVPVRPGRGHAQILLWAIRATATVIFSLCLVTSVFTRSIHAAVPPLAVVFAAALFVAARSLQRPDNWLTRISTRNWLWLLAMIAFGLRLAWALYARPEPVSDFATYRDLGLDLCAHGQYGYPVPSAYRPIGAPALVATISCAGLAFPFWYWVANAAFSAATTPGVFILATRLAGPRVARIASLLWVFWPAQIAGCALIATEPMCAFLLVWAVVLAMGTNGTLSWSRAVAVGLVLAATTYARSNAILIAPLWLGYALMLGRWTQALRIGLATVVLFAALLPWGIRNKEVMGEFNLTTTNGGVWMTYGNFNEASGGSTNLTFELQGKGEVEQNREGYRLAKAWIISHPWRFLYLIPFKWKATFDQEAAEVGWSTRQPWMAKYVTLLRIIAEAWYLALTGLFFLGVWRMKSAQVAEDAASFAAMEWYALIFGAWLAVHVFFPGDQRYHAPLLPWYCGFAAVALLGHHRPQAPGQTLLSAGGSAG